MRTLIVTVVGTMLIAGCASQWRPRPGAHPGELAEDRYRCTQESRTGFSAGGTGRAGAGAIMGAAIAAQANAQYLLDLCMEARGHIKVERVAGEPAATPLTVGVPQSTTAAVTQRSQQPQVEPKDESAATPPGRVDPVTYYAPYPGAELVPMPPHGGPVQPEFAVRGPPPRVAAAPQIIGLKGESTYMLVAEQLAKTQGCTPPVAAMTTKGAGQESFTVACPNGTTIAIKCSGDGCRVLR